MGFGAGPCRRIRSVPPGSDGWAHRRVLDRGRGLVLSWCGPSGGLRPRIRGGRDDHGPHRTGPTILRDRRARCWKSVVSDPSVTPLSSLVLGSSPVEPLPRRGSEAAGQTVHPRGLISIYGLLNDLGPGERVRVRTRRAETAILAELLARDRGCAIWLVGRGGDQMVGVGRGCRDLVQPDEKPKCARYAEQQVDTTPKRDPSVTQERTPSAETVSGAQRTTDRCHRYPKAGHARCPPRPHEAAHARFRSLACRLTSAVARGSWCWCCSACRRGMGRPPPDHLEVPLTELSRQRQAVVVSVSVPYTQVVGEGSCADDLVELVSFREEFYRCLSARSDAVFELTDALLCSGDPVTTLVDLSLTPEHRRGHGALYDGLNCGRVDIDRLRRAVGALPCREAAMAGSSWPSISARGCARMRQPAPSERSVTSTVAVGIKHS
nr:transposase [Rhodococcus sp. WB9]